MALAVLFVASALLYAVLWMSAVRLTPMVEFGFDNSSSLLVTHVFKGSPAEAAGLLRGDRILAINGKPVQDELSLYREYRPHKPGDRIEVTIARPGERLPRVLTGAFRQRRSIATAGGLTQYFAGEIRNLYPIPFLLVGFTVLFLRLEDPHVWLLALMFASLIAPGIPNGFASVAPVLRPFAAGYQAIFVGLLGADFYAFFAVFPIRSPIDRRLPWLKWVAAVLGLTFGVAGFRVGYMRVPQVLAGIFGQTVSEQIPLIYIFGFIVLGLISLAANFFGTSDREARRKMRVMFWGTGVGMTAGTARAAAISFAHIQPPWWLDTVVVLLAFVIPLSFAYAVVKHRVLEIPVLLKRSARYLLVQRGFVLLLSLVSVALTLVFASFFERYFHPLMAVAQPAGIAVGVIFGTLLLWGGLQVHRRVSARIDRAFFRSAYDARSILGDLAERARTATDRVELAHVLERHIKEALHPEFVVVYLQASDSNLTAMSGMAPQDLTTISPDIPALVELARGGQARELTPSGDGSAAGPTLARLHPECLAPMLGRRGGLAGLLVLGPRLSEEPYSGEDKRLLTAVASQAGTALENLSLAEEIAERMEAERRAAREMEIAKAVQARLLPQTAPCLQTLECAARCLEARLVGGDYYDFLRLGPDRLGLVLADVSGKGIAAALLMANLQAHLHNQTGITPFDPVQSLRRVNRMLWECTDPQHYATMFFGAYQDSTRRLVYVNCGHNPPICLHRDGTLERLEATATVIGLFEHWDCTAKEMQLAPGDVLVIFSDGITEAAHNDEEFGEDRLLNEVRAQSQLSADEIATAILRRVLKFSAGTQSDDLTLLVARTRSQNVECT